MLKRIPKVGEIVYHPKYGKGTVFAIDALYYYGIKFGQEERLVHDSELFHEPVQRMMS